MIGVIIAGTRTFDDYELLKEKCDKWLKYGHPNDLVILSGGAKGADKLGERYAKERNLNLEIYPANWEKYGKSAGIKRNIQMGNNADILIAFWDGKSRGTKHMIDYANKQEFTTVVVIDYEENLEYYSSHRKRNPNLFSGQTRQQD